VIKTHKIIIELDGAQHFKQVSNWQDPLKTQQIDIFKTKQANANGYSVIRLLQQDVWLNKNNCINRLIDAINQLIQSKKVENKYITYGDEYENYICG
jgi:very-short-patch-repair endonuclease